MTVRKSAAKAYMPFYTGDWAKSTKLLNDTQYAQYHRLLVWQWDNEQLFNEQQAAKIAEANTPAKRRDLSEVLAAKFTPINQNEPRKQDDFGPKPLEKFIKKTEELGLENQPTMLVFEGFIKSTAAKKAKFDFKITKNDKSTLFFSERLFLELLRYEKKAENKRKQTEKATESRRSRKTEDNVTLNVTTNETLNVTAPVTTNETLNVTGTNQNQNQNQNQIKKTEQKKERAAKPSPKGEGVCLSFSEKMREQVRAACQRDGKRFGAFERAVAEMAKWDGGHTHENGETVRMICFEAALRAAEAKKLTPAYLLGAFKKQWAEWLPKDPPKPKKTPHHEKLLAAMEVVDMTTGLTHQTTGLKAEKRFSDWYLIGEGVELEARLLRAKEKSDEI
jgi:hypothetical protein